jgi:serine/threonine-protein kinase
VKRGSAVRLELAAGPPKPKPATPSTPSTTTHATPPPPSLVAVPNVRGLRLAGARAALRGAGLVTEVHTVPSSQPTGTVVAQSPTAGRRVKKGSHVLVNVSQHPTTSGSGTQQTTPSQGNVPDVVGQDAASATATLQQAGFAVDQVDSPTSDQTQDGMVVDEQPAGGTQAASGSSVTISIGRYSATG